MNRRLAIPIVVLYALSCGVAQASTPTNTQLAASPTSTNLGQAVILTATVLPNTATGAVTFYSGATMLGAATLSGGTATFTTKLLPVGTNAIKAFYLGDSNNSKSASTALNVTVTAKVSSGFTVPAGSAPTVTSPEFIAYGYFNNDDKLDLAVSQHGGGVAILLGGGDGTFTLKTTVLGTTAAADLKVADFDGDGKADLAILVNASNGTIAGHVIVVPGFGDGTFDEAHAKTTDIPVPTPPGLGVFASGQATGLAVADFNGDGNADIAVAQTQIYTVTLPWIQNYVTVFKGNGNGTFGSATQVAVNDAPTLFPSETSGDVAVGFFRGTGPDIIASDLVPGLPGLGGVYYIQGDGAGNFGSATPIDPHSPLVHTRFALGDFNGDGNLDFAWLDVNGIIDVGLGNGGGTFAMKNTNPSQGVALAGFAAGDFNGDGKLDVVFSLPGSNKVAVARGKGDGTFNAIGTSDLISTDAQPYWIVAADINADGRTDFAVAAQNDSMVSVRLGAGPNLTSMSPSSMVVGASSDFTLTLTGSNFASTDVVTWTPSGSTTTTNLTTVYVNAQQLTATVPHNLVATLGTATVQVSDSSVSGLTSSNLTFTIGSGPTITTLSPSSAATGSAGFTLTITGTNFVTGDVVIWTPAGGTAQNLTNTTVSNATTLTVPITAAMIAAPGTATVAVKDPNGPVTTTLTFTIAAPGITSLSPTGVAAGGNAFNLTINGSNLSTGSTVVWTPTGGTAVQISNTTANGGGTTLTVPISAAMIAAQGSITVSVQGTSSVPLAFAIGPGPQITSLSQTSAVAGGAAFTLTIYGTGFATGDTVTWKPTVGATQNLGSPTVNSAGTQVTASVAAALLTAVDSGIQIKVVDPGGAASNAGTFTVAGPVISSINPNSVGTANGAITATIAGSNFVAGSSGSTVNVSGPGGSQSGIAPSASSSTSLTIAIPSAVVGNSPGTIQVTVVNPGGATSAQAPINVAAPAITALNPPSGTTGGSTDLTITITGTGFSPTARAIWCNACTTGTALTTTVTSSTTLTAVIPMSNLTTTGVAQIWVNNTSSSLTDPNLNSPAVNFPIASLTISSISPSFALAGSPQFTMTINGTNFASGASILWGALAPLQPTSLTTGLITVLVPADHVATAAQYPVAVQNPNGSVSPAVTFTVGQLAITSLAPSPIVAGTNGLVLTVNGQYFDSSTRIQWVSGTTTSLTTNYIDSQTMTASVPASLITSAGTAQITALESTLSVTSTPVIVNVGGPTIGSITPTSSGVGVPTFSLQVSGLNFLTGSTVLWESGLGQAQSLPTTFVNSSSLMALVPTSLVASAGTALITVQNPGNGATGAISNGMVFTIGPAPTIKTDGTGLTPGSTIAGGPGFTLSLLGTNYQPGAVVVWTENGTATSLATAYSDSSHLSASVPAGLIASAGAALITVQNPGSVVSNAVLFPISTATAPTINTLTPSTAAVGGSAFQLNVAGTNFVNGAQVSWTAGSTPQLLSTSYVSSTQVSALVPASLISAAGTAFITVANPGSSASNALSLPITTAGPTLTSLGQTTAAAGSTALTLGVTGTNFTSTSIVQWNAGSGPVALATSFVSSTNLTALVPAALLATGGIAFVNVLNTGDVTSNSKTFTIEAVPAVNAAGLTPNTANAGGPAFQMLVVGSNFVSGASVLWNGVALAATSFLNANQLLAIVPATEIASAGTALVSVQNLGGETSNVVAFTVTAAAPSAPTIGSLSPQTATAGGSAFLLVITGTNFTSASTVQWNPGTGVQAQQLATTFVSSTQLSALVPMTLIASAGTAFVSVQNAGVGSSNLTALVISPAASPSINTTAGLTPAQVTAGGTTFQLGVTGANFQSGATVQWNAGSGAQSLATVFVSASQLTALVPAGLITAAGSIFVSVQNPGGAVSNMVTFAVNAAAAPSQPTVTALNPSSGVTVGGAAFQLTVTGTNFVTGSTVQWSTGGVAQSLTTYVASGTQLSAIVPASLIAAVGMAFVSVQNPGGIGSNLTTFAITPVTPPSVPTIASGGLSPSSTTAGGAAFQLIVTGTSFVNTSVVQWYAATGTAAQQLVTTYISDTQLAALVPAALIAGAGTAYVNVQTPSVGGSVLLPFTINPLASPTINASGGLSPGSAVAGTAGFQLGVTGTNFATGAVVQWNAGTGAQALATVYVSANQLIALVPATLITSAGSFFVSVQNPGGAISNLVTFTVSPASAPAQPTIASLSPATGTAGGTAFMLTVNGSNFATSSVVSWNTGGTPQVLVTTYVSASQLTAIVPASSIAAAGTAFVTVQNTGSLISNISTFTVQAVAAPPVPAISAGGLSPSSATVGGVGFLLIVTGTNFVASSAVEWTSNSGGQQALATTFLSSTQLSAVVPSTVIANGGAAFVSVQTPGAGSSNLVVFTINPAAQPGINTSGGLSPAQATAGAAGFLLGVTGSNFVNGSVVQWNSGSGAQNLATAFVSATQLTAQVPAAQIASVANVFVGVLNPTGATSNLVAFPINAAPAPAQPTIATSGLAPVSATAGAQGFQLTISGTNFVTGSVVQWSTGGAVTSLVTYYTSTTQLSAVVSAALIASPATAFLSVVNPGNIQSNMVTFAISAAVPTVPALATISPTAATVGDAAFQIQLAGANFTSASVVEWSAGGSAATPLTTGFVSPTGLTALVPATLVASVGPVLITVQNPGNLVSNSLSFTINVAPPPASPTVTAGGLAPGNAMAGATSFQLSVTGSNFVSGAVVQWTAEGGTPQALPTNYMTSSQVVASVQASLIASPGTVFISVKNPSGAVSNLVSFVVSAMPTPTIMASGVSPASVALGTNGVSLTITGTNFVNGSKVQWDSGAGVQALSTGFTSSTQLYVIVPATLLAAPATVMISVLNPSGAVSNSVLFSVTGQVVVTPTLTTITPASTAAGSASFSLALIGTNFVAASNTGNGSVVQWNGSALPTTFVTATQLTALVASSLLQATGSNFVMVVNPGGATSAGATFQVAGPGLVTMSPSSLTAGAAAFTLTVTGANFVAGSSLAWNGSSLPTTFNSSTQLSAMVPANLVAAAGTAFVLVANPGGASSAPQAFTIAAPNAPTLSGLNPPAAVAGSAAFQLTVIGSGFANGAQVMWNGVQLATGFVSSTQLTALVDSTLISTAGTANISVQVTGAPLSASLKFPINGPTIATLNPSTASAGDPAFSLTVTGTNFVPGASVMWNGAQLPTTYTNSTQLSAIVGASYLRSATSAAVTVQNPGGAVSTSATFTVGPPSLRTTTTSLPDGVVGTFYSQTLSATGGTLPFTWSISSGALPSGLSLDAPSGTISGTPTAAAAVVLGVTVADSLGRTAAVSLNLRTTLALTVTTASPLSAALAGVAYSNVLAASGGTPPYLWSVAGILPPGLLLNVATGEISGTPTIPGGYNFTITVTDSRQQQTASKSFNSVVSVPALTIGGVGSLTAPAQQVPVTITTASAYSVDLTGSLTVSFTSTVGGDDPSIQFSTVGRTVNFTIAAGTTQAVFGQNQQLTVSTGTVAGTILLKASLHAGSSDITPSPAPQASTSVPKQAPVVTSVSLQKTSTGVILSFAGYTTTKEATQATIQFNAASGSTLTASTITLPLAAPLAAWYSSVAAAAFGSQFTMNVPFNIAGDLSAIGSVTVVVANSQGNSAGVTGTFK